jgi:hypothetical protein
MRKIKTILGFCAAAVLLFAACEEVESTDLTLDLTKKATVRAYFYAELDYTILGDEFAPNGTKVIVSIPNSSFNSSASGNWVDSATINNGMIEIEVPATNAGVTVTITPAEFVYDQKQAANQNSSIIKKIFSVSAVQTIASVKPGETRTKQIDYNTMTQFNNFTETVSLKFELRANVDENVLNEFVPASTVITLYTTEWTTTATVAASGRIDVSVPKDETISLRFEANKALVGPPASTKKYRYSKTFSNTDETTPVLQSIDFGDGEVWE